MDHQNPQYLAHIIWWGILLYNWFFCSHDYNHYCTVNCLCSYHKRSWLFVPIIQCGISLYSWLSFVPMTIIIMIWLDIFVHITKDHYFFVLIVPCGALLHSWLSYVIMTIIIIVWLITFAHVTIDHQFLHMIACSRFNGNLMI